MPPTTLNSEEPLNNDHALPKLIAYDWINESELRE